MKQSEQREDASTSRGGRHPEVTVSPKKPQTTTSVQGAQLKSSTRLADRRAVRGVIVFRDYTGWCHITVCLSQNRIINPNKRRLWILQRATNEKPFSREPTLAK